MSERESASPRHDPDARLGDLFENLPDPTQQSPTVDNSAPTPGSRRAAREAATGRATTPADGTPVAAPESEPVPVRSAADAGVGVEASATPVRDSADAGDTPTRAVPQVTPVVTDPQPVLGGGLDDLFAPHEDERAASRKPKKKRRTGCLIALVIVLAILGGIAAGGAWVWNTYGERISEALGWGEPKDWEPGLATGEALVTIKSGDTGGPVSVALFEAGVTKTENVFYDYLVKEAPGVTFYPGVYKLQEKMTAEAALAALQDEKNKMANAASVPEGATMEYFLPTVAEGLGMPLADFEAAIADPSVYGVQADSLEGWLFPAVYDFDPDITATQVIQRMVDRTRESLAAAGVPSGDEQRVLTIASIIQREGRTDDFPKVSRVIENRLAPGNSETNGLLQMDSTAQYGVGELHAGAAGSSEKALTDPNPWNTYIHPGLPKGPISTATDKAIDAAMHPADGPWFYFVTVNLESGETVFSATYAEQLAAEKTLHAWCKDNPDAGCYAG